MNKKAKIKTVAKNKSPKTLKVSKPKRYELKALGYCIEVTAHKLSSEQLREVKEHCKQEDLDLKGDVGNLEDYLEGYDMYDTNMWQSSTVPFLGSCGFVLFDSKDKPVFEVEDISKYSSSGTEVFTCKRGKGDVAVAHQEFKGTSAIWFFETNEVPELKDFNFRIGKIIVGDDEIEFVEGVDYKGQELERDYDGEFYNGKAFYTYLL